MVLLETGEGEKEDGHGFEGKLSHDQLLPEPDQATNFEKKAKFDPRKFKLHVTTAMHEVFESRYKSFGTLLEMLQS